MSARAEWVWDGYVLRAGADGREIGGVKPLNRTSWFPTKWVVVSEIEGTYLGFVPDEFTARAVAVALAGFDPGVVFTLALRADWTRAAVNATIDAGLGHLLAPMLSGWACGDVPNVEQSTRSPDVVLKWWTGGCRALDLRAQAPSPIAKEMADDTPF